MGRVYQFRLVYLAIPEEQLRSEYQSQLDEKASKIEALTKQQDELQATIDSHQATIDKQMETITDLSSKSTANQRTEQLNRELTNRSDKLQDEVTELKKRVKALQKEARRGEGRERGPEAGRPAASERMMPGPVLASQAAIADQWLFCLRCRYKILYDVHPERSWNEKIIHPLV